MLLRIRQRAAKTDLAFHPRSLSASRKHTKSSNSSAPLPTPRKHSRSIFDGPSFPGFSLEQQSSASSGPAVVKVSEKVSNRVKKSTQKVLGHLTPPQQSAQHASASKPISKKAKKKGALALTSSIEPVTENAPEPPPHFSVKSTSESRASRRSRQETPSFPNSHSLAKLGYSRLVEGLLQPRTSPVLETIQSPSEHKPINTLAHNLDRVLFNPGVHWLQDPRSGVYNFTPWLEDIPKPEDFAFERLAGFVKSSQDNDLWTLLKRENRIFAGSTSSLSGMLSQIYFLISGDREVNTYLLSADFANESKSFTPGQRMPVSVLFNHKDGTYTIDSDKDGDDTDKNILTWMGHLLERFLTANPEEFKTYLRSSDKPPPDSNDTRREAYRYSKSDSFVMRSQLDCVDPRLPGSGVFDIKTRAAVPIRLDLMNFEENSGYLIRKLHGLSESFEKEYYDLIRSAFLKYSFQVRIGGMDGVMVAYHNTAKMFGFQYLPLEEMETCLYGPGVTRGERVFEKCVGMLELLAPEVVNCFPGQSVKATFETREFSGILDVFVQAAEWEGEDEAERPIKHITVTANNYISDNAVRGHQAVARAEGPWTIHYTLKHSLESQEEINNALLAAKDRQFRAYNIPTGLAIEELPAFWNSLNFSGQPVESSTKFNSRLFKKPSGSVEAWRELARQGKLDSQMKEEEVTKRFVLGQSEPIEVVSTGGFIEEVAEIPEEVILAESVNRAGTGCVEIPSEDLERSAGQTVAVSTDDEESISQLATGVRDAIDTSATDEGVKTSS